MNRQRWREAPSASVKSVGGVGCSDVRSPNLPVAWASLGDPHRSHRRSLTAAFFRRSRSRHGRGRGEILDAGGGRRFTNSLDFLARAAFSLDCPDSTRSISPGRIRALPCSACTHSRHTRRHGTGRRTPDHHIARNGEGYHRSCLISPVSDLSIFRRRREREEKTPDRGCRS
jgi:hypothetical protein